MSKVLIIIDMQKAFNDQSWGQRNNPSAEKNSLRLLEIFRAYHLEVVHIQHISGHSDSLFHIDNDQAFKEGFEPKNHEIIFQKTVNSAFIGTGLLQYLKERQLQDLTIVGLTLPYCVSTTARMASNLGFDVTLIHDATASFELYDHQGDLLQSNLVHHYNLAALNQEFATICSTDEWVSQYISTIRA